MCDPGAAADGAAAAAPVGGRWAGQAPAPPAPPSLTCRGTAVDGTAAISDDFADDKKPAARRGRRASERSADRTRTRTPATKATVRDTARDRRSTRSRCRRAPRRRRSGPAPPRRLHATPPAASSPTLASEPDGLPSAPAAPEAATARGMADHLRGAPGGGARAGRARVLRRGVGRRPTYWRQRARPDRRRKLMRLDPRVQSRDNSGWKRDRRKRGGPFQALCSKARRPPPARRSAHGRAFRPTSRRLLRDLPLERSDRFPAALRAGAGRGPRSSTIRRCCSSCKGPRSARGLARNSSTRCRGSRAEVVEELPAAAGGKACSR